MRRIAECAVYCVLCTILCTVCCALYIVSTVAGAGAAAAQVPGPEDSDWVAPHQNTVTHVDPHAPLAGLPPGEGNPHPLPPPPPASLCLLSLSILLLHTVSSDWLALRHTQGSRGSSVLCSNYI